MVEYKCKKCNKVFHHYGNYNYHVMRIFPCDVKKELVNYNKKTKKEIIAEENSYNNDDSIIEEITANTEENEEVSELICMYCKKTFSRKDVCKRHEKYNCKNKKIFEKERENKKLINELKKTKQTIINNFQTVNNYQQNIQNNIQQNFNGFTSEIPINPFGKEDISFLTHGIMKNILKNPDNGIAQLIRLIHFNPEIPQNQNVRLKNKKEPYLNVFNGKNWELRDKDDTIQDLIISKKEIADDYFENLLTQQDVSIIQKQDNIINALTQKKYETYTEAIDDYLNTIILDEDSSKKIIMNKYKRLYDKLYKQINLILLNNTQLANHIEANKKNAQLLNEE